MLHLRDDEVMNDTLPLPFLCTRRARGCRTMRSRLSQSPKEGNVFPRINSISFQRARLCILPSLAIPRIRLAASLPPQIESFPGSLGLLKAPVAYFWTPDHEAQDIHLTERGAGQSLPGLLELPLPSRLSPHVLRLQQELAPVGSLPSIPSVPGAM